ncbi:IPT/TIG domain-containing protein [Flavobacterium marginilacus]|uniref:IPT/TIG domain-containing protein n=1 Tax=Flavobacterium marginilacus TaxID=3003256 RepID=UPI00248E88E1|nr:IPT/TIG domain-containing protein [Flavobacterium marginilacus]
MKHFFSILALFILISCSSDDSEDNQDQKTIIQSVLPSLSASSTNIGETITINGQNFNPNIACTIKFNGTNGQITQITSNTISVTVPVGATSGQIELTTNGVTLNVGYITVNGTNRLFAYKQWGTIVELNPVTGAETKTLVYGTGSNYLKDLGYFAPTNEIIAQGVGNTSKLFKVKLTDKTVKEITFAGYDQLIITSTKLYGYKSYEGIIELNPNTGSEIGNLINTGNTSGDYLYGLIYNDATNEIIGEKYGNDKNVNLVNKICKIKLFDNSVIESTYSGYDELIPASNGKLYAYRGLKRIVELNPATGAENKTLKNISDPHISNFTYFPQTNQLIGKKNIYNNGIVTSKFLKLNLTDNSLSENNILKDDYDYLIVTN